MAEMPLESKRSVFDDLPSVFDDLPSEYTGEKTIWEAGEEKKEPPGPSFPAPKPVRTLAPQPVRMAEPVQAPTPSGPEPLTPYSFPRALTVSPGAIPAEEAPKGPLTRAAETISLPTYEQYQERLQQIEDAKKAKENPPILRTLQDPTALQRPRGWTELSLPELLGVVERQPKKISAHQLAADYARAQNIIAIQRETGVSPSEIEQNYDQFTKELGMRTKATKEELVEALFKTAIGLGLITHPVSTIVGVGTYMGVKEIESLATQIAKKEKPKILAGRELIEFLGPLEEHDKALVEALEFAAPGALSAKFFTMTKANLSKRLASKLIHDAWDEYLAKKAQTETGRLLPGPRIEGTPPSTTAFEIKEPRPRTILRPKGEQPRGYGVQISPEGEPIYPKGRGPLISPLPKESVFSDLPSGRELKRPLETEEKKKEVVSRETVKEEPPTPLMSVRKQTSGVWKGGYIASVKEEGEFKNIVGFGNTPEEAKKEVLRAIATRRKLKEEKHAVTAREGEKGTEGEHPGVGGQIQGERIDRDLAPGEPPEGIPTGYGDRERQGGLAEQEKQKEVADKAKARLLDLEKEEEVLLRRSEKVGLAPPEEKRLEKIRVQKAEVAKEAGIDLTGPTRSDLEALREEIPAPVTEALVEEKPAKEPTPVSERIGKKAVALPKGWKTEIVPGFRRTPGWRGEVDWKNKRIVFETPEDAQDIGVTNHEIAHIQIEDKLGAVENLSDSSFLQEYAEIRKEPKDSHINFIREHVAMDYGEYLDDPKKVAPKLRNLFERYFFKEELAQKPKAKESWEMTHDEYLKSLGMDTRFIPPQPKKESARVWRVSEDEVITVGEHEKAVRQALSEGKPVPENVLKDYPDLTKQKVETAAAEAATSPKNDLPEPTEPQKEAGNFKKGHVSLHGLDISIEYPKGSDRTGTSPDGKKWEMKMAHHYGYILGTKGKDKDHIDVFIGPYPESEFVAVIDQVKPETEKFDEHKIMLGFRDMASAKVGYLANYEPGWKGLGAAKGFDILEFKDWLKEGDTTKPASELQKKPEEPPVKKEAEWTDFNVEYKQAGKEPDERFDSYEVTAINPKTHKRQKYVSFDATKRGDLEEYLKAKGVEASIPDLQKPIPIIPENIPEKKPTLDLTITGQAKESPDRPYLNYTVNKRKPDFADDRTFRVIMTKTEGGFLSVAENGKTAQEAYDNALAEYDRKMAERKAPLKPRGVPEIPKTMEEMDRLTMGQLEILSNLERKPLGLTWKWNNLQNHLYDKYGYKGQALLDLTVGEVRKILSAEEAKNLLPEIPKQIEGKEKKPEFKVGDHVVGLEGPGEVVEVRPPDDLGLVRVRMLLDTGRYSKWENMDRLKSFEEPVSHETEPTKEPETEEATERPTGYAIRLGTGKWEEVKGTPVKAEELPEYEFFVYKTDRGWKVTEKSTGFGVSSLRPTKQEAIDDFKQVISDAGVERVKGAISKAQKEETEYKAPRVKETPEAPAPKAPPPAKQETPTTGNRYQINPETGKMELYFDKADFNKLPSNLREEIRARFLWAPSKNSWVSKAHKDLYWPKQIVEKLKKAGVFAEEKAPEEKPKPIQPFNEKTAAPYKYKIGERVTVKHGEKSYPARIAKIVGEGRYNVTPDMSVSQSAEMNLGSTMEVLEENIRSIAEEKKPELGPIIITDMHGKVVKKIEEPKPEPEPEPEPPVKGFAAEVLVEGKWSRNALVFATQEEAERYGDDLFSRWFAAKDKRVIEVNETPNYRFIEGELKGIEPKMTSEEKAAAEALTKDRGAVLPDLKADKTLERLQKVYDMPEKYVPPSEKVSLGKAIEVLKAGEKDAAKPLLEAAYSELWRQHPDLADIVDKVIEEIYPEAPKQSPSRQVTDWVKGKLATQEMISREDLLKQAAEAYGGKISEGKYTAKDAFDAMEVAVNEYILEETTRPPTQDEMTGRGTKRTFDADPTAPTTKAAQVRVDLIRSEVMSKIPSQVSIRTPEQEEFQQFSTPPDLAYTMAWAANIGPNDTALEPSAGTGSLAIFAKATGAKTIVNELSSRRAELLKGMGFDQVFTENAEQLNNILPKDVKPTVVLMNPPFSSTAGRIPGQRQSANVVKHLDQALKRLDEGGRLVALIGKGWFDDPKAVSSFLKNLVDNFNLRANITVEGKGYAKYGTTYDNRILVVDKTPPEGRPTVEATVEDVKDAIPLLQEVRDARTIAKPRPAEPSLKGIPERPEGQARPEPTVLPPTHELGPGEREVPGERLPAEKHPGEPPRGEPSGRLPVSETVGGQRGVPGRKEPQPVQESGGPRISPPGGIGLEGQPSPEGLSPGETATVTLEKTKQEEAPSDITDSLYENYKPKKAVVKGSRPHPGPIVESAAMASVDPPAASYLPKIPKDIIEKGNLSNVQLESIIYAGQAHQQILPSGERMGFFIGDGTGVGKGREIAGILLDNWNQGRKKAIWLSQNSPLIEDAKRDVKGVGWNPDLIFDVGKIKFGMPIKNTQGIAFLGYDLLRAKKEDKSRLAQVIEWFGKDYDGVVIFDESHNMGNAIATKGKMGTKKPAEKALAGLELQKALPKARVVYVSATGATEVMNFAYAQRLGLWGQGTAFADAGDFITKVSAGGISTMEYVARDMKAMGKYAARSLSYDGVKYQPLQHILNPEQREIYDQLAEAWQICLQNINAALEATGVTGIDEHTGRKKTLNGRAKAAAMSAFWGSHQRFFNQIITAMQMPTAIKAIEKDLEKGNSVVIQLVNTNEAATKRMLSRMEEEDELEDLDITPREQLMEFVRNSFPTTQYQQAVDDNGNIISVPVKDSAGNFVQSEEAVAMREALLDRLGSIKVPDNPLDTMINHFGSNKVAEVTGRTQRVVDITDEKGTHRAIERRSKAKAMSDADAFMNDRKQILVFSYAGGTGRSYHADLTVKNQRPRMHYLVQPGWRADRAVQGLGRTHRTNQAQPPEYFLVTTDLNGQKRFISSIARRLDQLGALTKGQRQTGGQGLFSERDNLESKYAEDALERLIEDVARGNIPDLGLGEFAQQLGLNLIDAQGQLNVSNLPDMPQFLNRLLSLKIDTQNKVFDLFSERLDLEIAKAIENGTLDAGLETIKANKIEKIGEQTIHTDEKTRAETKFVELELTRDAQLIPWDKSDRFAKGGYVQNIRSGRVWALSDAQLKTSVYTGEVTRSYKATGVNYGIHSLSEEDIKDPEKYVRLNKKEAQKAWKDEHSAFPKEVKQREYLVTGALLPIYNRLPEGNARIVRLQTSEGERMLGRLIPPSQLEGTKQRLGAETTAIQMGPREVLEDVLHHGYSIELANSWRIVRRKVLEEQRVEILGPEWREAELLKKWGLIQERIQWQTRYFIPNSEEGINVIEKILDNNPIIKATPKERAAEDIVAASKVRISKKAVGAEEEPLSPKEEFTLRQFVESKGLKWSEFNEMHPDYINLKAAWDLIKSEKGAVHIPTIKELKEAFERVFPRELRESIYQNIVNRFAAIENLDARAKALGAKILPGESPQKRGREYLGISQKVQSVLANKTYRIKPDGKIEITGEGLKPILDEYDKLSPEKKNKVKIQEFNDYFGAVLDIEDLQQPKSPWTQEEYITPQQVAIAQAKLDALRKKYGNLDHFEAIAPRLYEYQQRVLHFLVDSGNMSEEMYQALLKKYPHYVPSDRIIEEIEPSIAAGGPKAKKPFTEARSPLKRRKGSELERHDIVGSIIKNTYRIMDVSERNTVARNVAKLKGFKELEIEEVEPPMVPVGTVKLKAQVDPKLKVDILDMIRTLGGKYERKVKIGGTRFGYFMEPDKIVTRFASQESVDAHELGHFLDTLYGLKERLTRRGETAKELRALADLRGGRKAYIRKGGEKIAALVDAYITKPQILDKVAPESKKVLNQIIKENPELEPLKKIKPSMVAAYETTEETIWGRSPFKPKGQIIEYYENGEKKYLDVPKNLYDAMTGLNEVSSDFLVRLMSAPSWLLRTGVTSSVDFMVRNFLRDQQTGFIQSQVGIRPLIDTVAAIADILGKTDIYYDAMRAGAFHSTFVDLSRRNLEEMGKRLRSDQSIFRYLNIINDAQAVSQLIEQATRLGIYRAAIRKGLSPVEAAFEFREGTVDFGVRGQSRGLRTFSSITAFFNPGIQGTARTFRAFRNHPWNTTLWALATITAPSVFLWLKNRDDDEYKELPRWQKDLFWLIKVGDRNSFITWVRYPKPFLWGQIFGSSVERFLDYLYTKDPKAVKDLATTLIEASTPVQGDPAGVLLPTGLRPLIENATNWQFFRQAPVVPQSRQKLLPYLQYTRYTTQTAKAIGKALNWSPAKVENFIRGIAGGTGQYSLEAIDEAIRIIQGEEKEGRRPREAADYPLLKAFVPRPVLSDPQSLRDFYEMARELEQSYLSYRNSLKDIKAPEAKEILKNHPFLFLSPSIENRKETIANLNKQIDMWSRSTKISDDQKRDKIRRLETLRLRIAQRGIKMMEAHPKNK